jgi:hypothetical protein
MTKYPKEQLHEERGFFGLWFQSVQSMVTWPVHLGRTSWWQVCGEGVSHHMAGGKQKVRKGLRTRYNLQDSPLGYFLNQAPPSKMAPPKTAGNQTFKTQACEGHFIFRPKDSVPRTQRLMGIS